MSGGNIWIQMGDEETPDREQETGDRRGLVTLDTYTRLLDFASWEHGDYFPFFLLLSLLYSGSSLAVVPIEVCI